MAEHGEEPESEAQETLDQASPAAVALALGRTSKAGKPFDAEATAFLRDLVAMDSSMNSRAWLGQNRTHSGLPPQVSHF